MQYLVYRAGRIILPLAIIFLSSYANSQPLTSSEQVLVKEKVLNLFVRINAPVDSVWSRWTSSKGLENFFAPVCHIDPKPLGRLDVWFDPSAPKGQRGAEDNMVTTVQEKKMISFTWDAPPQWPEIRKQRTLVTFRFYEVGKDQTLVTFSQTGWGVGDQWDQVYDYFAKAWGGFVLPSLKHSLEVAPINWSDFPNSMPALKPAEKF